MLAARAPHGLDRESPDDRLMAVQMLLKAADVSNVCKPWRLAQKWGDVLLDEFFQQGDHEHRLGLTPAAFMDRSKTTRSKVSINFIDYVAGALFTEVTFVLLLSFFFLLSSFILLSFFFLLSFILLSSFFHSSFFFLFFFHSFLFVLPLTNNKNNKNV